MTKKNQNVVWHIGSVPVAMVSIVDVKTWEINNNFEKPNLMIETHSSDLEKEKETM